MRSCLALVALGAAVPVVVVVAPPGAAAGDSSSDSSSLSLLSANSPFSLENNYEQIKYQLLNMSNIKRGINQQDLKIVGLHVVYCEWFSLTCSCKSRQRDTTSSEVKLQINNWILGVHWER